MHKQLITLLIFLFVSTVSFSQKGDFYRIRADVSIKEKSTDGKSNLTMGQVYFDKLHKKIVYNIVFPEKEIWIFKDTLMYNIKNQKVEKKPLMPGFVDFSIFNLALGNKLKDYGLKNSMYVLKETVKEENMVITTWVPKKEFEKALGEIKISVVDNKLYGVVFFNHQKVMIGKQIFSNYIVIKGLEFPCEILNFSYLQNGGEIHQLTTFKNIKVNDWTEDTFYNYAVPRK